MEQEKPNQNISSKPEGTSVRACHDLRNMRLTGKERDLAQIIGNVVAGRLGPKAQEKVLDVIMSEMTQKPKRDELLRSVEAVGLEYDLDDGLKRQRARDEAVANNRD